MSQDLDPAVSVLVPTGALGAGIQREHVWAGLAAGADAIACDAGSTDSGPAYLATGRPKYSRGAVKADLAILMLAQAKAGIPLLIGSCGTSGADAALDWTCEIALEIAAEHGLSPRIALLRSEQDPEAMAAKAGAGRIRPLAPHKEAPPELFRSCDRIVALMGPEPYVAALEAGADIVLGGRTTDTAVLAAVPLSRGAGAGPAWHAGKIGECGGLCTRRTREGGVMIRVRADSFDVEPLAATNACDPYSVSSHMLYENADPFLLTEPGGVLDVREAVYEAIDDRRVRVRGSAFRPQPYTMKLEGAAGGPFQTVALVGIQDPEVLANLERFLAQMQAVMRRRLAEAMPGLPDDAVTLRPYGWNAVSGLTPPAGTPPPREVGLMLVATGPDQATATQIAKTCNPLLFHMPLDPETELPSYAFPFSPAEIERGQVYEFRLNHVVEVDDPLELVRISFVDAGAR
ncbi:acyclic terpene utilization AtuA family protein [Phenylobacterium sp. VNQ135]|uniref:acyclic terpene utilization AtuA family protein n=1 Tax=Phenylobacterium sp. VNQ135 TaxID=3400922 RepID=UPI003C10AFEF